MAAACPFIFPQIGQRNQLDQNPIHWDNQPGGITFLKNQTRNPCVQLNSNRWQSHTDDLIRLLEQQGSKFGHRKPKLLKRYDKFLGIVGILGDPNVETGCRARITMKGNGITPNYQIFNLVRVQQPQKLFEVVR